MLFCDDNQDHGLVNVFTIEVASNEQEHAGEEGISQFITYHILKQPAQNSTIHKKKLLTLSTSHTKTAKKTSHQLKESQQND